MTSGLPDGQRDCLTGLIEWVFHFSLHSSRSLCSTCINAKRSRHVCSRLPLKRCFSRRSFRRSIQNWDLKTQTQIWSVVCWGWCISCNVFKLSSTDTFKENNFPSDSNFFFSHHLSKYLKHFLVFWCYILDYKDLKMDVVCC